MTDLVLLFKYPMMTGIVDMLLKNDLFYWLFINDYGYSDTLTWPDDMYDTLPIIDCYWWLYSVRDTYYSDIQYWWWRRWTVFITIVRCHSVLLAIYRHSIIDYLR